MPAVTDICDSVVSAINAASLAGSFYPRLTAVEAYSLTLPMEESDELKVFIQPGPSHSEPGTLDGRMADETSVRMILQAQLQSCNNAAIKVYIGLVEKLCDQIKQRIPGYSFIFLDADPEDDQVYDQDRLRNDAVFYSSMLISFTSLRTP